MPSKVEDVDQANPSVGRLPTVVGPARMAKHVRPVKLPALAAALLAVSCLQPRAVGSDPRAGPPEQEAQAERVSWRLLTRWKYLDGTQGMPDSVKQLSGRVVEIAGYLIPIQDSELLLIESPATLATCDSEINQLVHVTLTQVPADALLGRKVKVTGSFKVGATYLDGYCVDVYRLRAHEVQVIQ